MNTSRTLLPLALAAGLLLTGCSASADSAENTGLSEEQRSVLAETASATLADAAGNASDRFAATIALTEQLHELESEIYSSVQEDFDQADYEVLPELIESNSHVTRAEVPITNEQATGAEGDSRLIFVWDGTAWKLDDLVEFYEGVDISLNDSFAEMAVPAAE